MRSRIWSASSGSSSRSAATRSSQVNPDVPPEQRTFVDYGAYVTFGYLSLDDNVDENHVLRQYELFPYVRLNFDGAHEFFLRGRVGWRDFNDGDSFDGRGDERIDADLDAATTASTWPAHRAAYQGEQIDDNLVVQGGRDLVYWANGLVLSQDIDGVTVDSRGGNDIVLSADRRRDADAHGRLRRVAPELRPQHPPRVFRRDAVQGARRRTGRSSTGWSSTTTTTTTRSCRARSRPSSSTTATTSASARPARSATGCSTASKSCYEGGKGLSNSFEGDSIVHLPIEQTEEDIHAWAADVRSTTCSPTSAARGSPAKCILASGDDDRA